MEIMLGLMFLVITLCIYVAIFALGIVTVVGMWKMFVKADKPGWASVVPFYNTYVLMEIAGLPVHWFYYLCIASVVSPIIAFIPLISSLTLFITIGIGVMYFYTIRMLNRVFGQNDDTANVLLTAFIPLILVYRAGFGNAQYLGAQSMHDIPVLPWFNNDSTDSVNSSISSQKPISDDYVPTSSSVQLSEQPVIDSQPMNIPPVSGGPSDPGVDMGSLPQMGSGNNKDQQQ